MNYRMIDQMVELETRLVIETNALYKAVLMTAARTLGTDRFSYNTETGVFSINVSYNTNDEDAYQIVFVKNINEGAVSVIIDRNGIPYAKCRINVEHKYFVEIGRIPIKDVRLLVYDLFDPIEELERDVVLQLVEELTPSTPAPTPMDRPITEMVREPIKETKPEAVPEGVTPMFTNPEEPAKDEPEDKKEDIVDVEPSDVKKDKSDEPSHFTEDGLSLDAVLNIGNTPQSTPTPAPREIPGVMNYRTPLTTRFDAGNDSFNALAAQMDAARMTGENTPRVRGNGTRFGNDDPVQLLPRDLLK